MFIINKQTNKFGLVSRNLRDARLDKLDSRKNSWTIIAIKNILLVSKVKMEVMNNYNANISDFASFS